MGDTPSVQITPIAIIRSVYLEGFATPRQPGLTSSTATIEFNSDIQAELALRGIDSYSHIWLIFGFHKNSGSYSPIVRPPRLKKEKVGVLSTRSPHRPNPLGLSLVEIVDIEDTKITVKGPDLIDGTPIFDIKPYLPEIEAIPGAQYDQNYERAPLKVIWSEHVTELSEDLKNSIQQHIELDPRPRHLIGQKSEFGLRLADTNVRFKVSEGTAEIINVEKYGNNI